MTRRLILAVPLLALVLTACSDDDNDEAEPKPATITVSATGEVEGTPDLLTVQLGVQTSGPKAQGAIEQNNTLAAGVIDQLKAGGVEDKDIQTVNLSVYPTYDERGRRITGYQVANTVVAKLRDLDNAGAVIDAAADAAGDAIVVQGLSFSIDDTSSLREGARADAMARAKAQATQLAEASGGRLGRLRSVTEAPRGVALPYANYLDRAAAQSSAGAAAPLEAGSQTVTLDLQVVYEVE